MKLSSALIHISMHESVQIISEGSMRCWY